MPLTSSLAPAAASARGRAAPRRIESRHNARVKELRAALLRGGVAREGGGVQIAMEGEHLVLEALRSGLALRTLFLREGSEALLERIAPGVAEVLVLSNDVFASAVTTETPQGIAALGDAPEFNLDEVLSRPDPLVLIAAGLQDPGNLGTLVRSAEAFGAAGVLALPGTVSVWNAKALRASSGSAFRLPVLPLSEDAAFSALARHRVRVLAAVAQSEAASPGPELHLTGPTALLIGNEGKGLSPALLRRAEAQITIPCPGPVESLNAAVAGSILLYEAGRQRMQSGAR